MNVKRIRTICEIGSGMMGPAGARQFAGTGYDVGLLGRTEGKLDEAKFASAGSCSAPS